VDIQLKSIENNKKQQKTAKNSKNANNCVAPKLILQGATRFRTTGLYYNNACN